MRKRDRMPALYCVACSKSIRGTAVLYCGSEIFHLRCIVKADELQEMELQDRTTELLSRLTHTLERTKALVRSAAATRSRPTRAPSPR
jgi:23S rRNA A2030 N6-methylase RlmJ